MNRVVIACPGCQQLNRLESELTTPRFRCGRCRRIFTKADIDTASTLRTARIASLNDLARTATGDLVQTAGISALPPASQSAIRERVETFDRFDKDNDPYGERDFGAFDYDGEKIFWKIDYYDAAMENGSEDPADPVQTRRVLTIMLASEY